MCCVSFTSRFRTNGSRLQGANSQILMTGGRGSDRGSYFIPKKVTTSEFVYPKKSLRFLAYPKKSRSPFFATPKNPSVFFFATHFWPKFQTQKSHSDPPPPPSPSLKYVSGAPGIEIKYSYFSFSLRMNWFTWYNLI